MWDTTTLNPAEDFDLFDGTESAQATYRPFVVGTDSFGTTVTVDCLFRELDEDNAMIGPGEAMVQRTVIHIPSNQLSNPPHRLDQVIRTNGVTYVVQSAKTQTFGTRYRIISTKAP